MTVGRASESPRTLLIEQVLPDYRAWLRKVASGILGPTHEALDDLVQEGYIAMWRAVETFDPDQAPADFWIKRSAHQRMLLVVRRHMSWTGLPDRRTDGGHGGNVPDRPVLSFAALNEHQIDYDPQDIMAGDAIEKAALGYHDGEILWALNQLAPREREYVVRRFWQGLTGPELDAVFHVHSPNIWKKARPILREALAHLVK